MATNFDDFVIARTAIGSLAGTDLLPIVDDPAGTPSTKKITAAELRGLTVHVVGLVENSEAAAAANTAAIQAAIDAAYLLSAARAPLTGGGSPRGAAFVELPPGNFYVDRSLDTDAWYCIKIKTSVCLRGSGWGTRLTLKSGLVTTTSEAGGAGNACSVIWFEDPSSFAGVEDLAVDGNKAGQTSTNAWSAGVDMRRDNIVEMYDGGLWLNHVMAWGCLGHGIMAGYAGGSHGNTTANTATIFNCYAYHNDGHGFFLKTDQRVVACKAGNNTGDGYRVYASTSCLITNCKGFGNDRDLTIDGSAQVIVDNFTSEDYTGLAGIFISGARACRVTGGVYRCMSTEGTNAALWVQDEGTAQTNPWHTHRPQTLDIQLTCYFQHDTGAANPVYFPKHLLYTRNVGGGTRIRIQHSGVNTTAAGDPTYATWQTLRWHTSGTDADADVAFNNNPGGYIVEAYAATVTPVADLAETWAVGALTGNITIANVADPSKGMRLTFLFEQDGTGGRTVTWGSAYKAAGWAVDPAASAKSTVSFVYDGTDWVRVAGNFADGRSLSNTQTGTSYTLVLGDAGKTVTMNNGSASTLTVPANSSVAFPVGTIVAVEQLGAGQVTISTGGTPTLRSRGGLLALAGQYAAASIRKIATDEWVVTGDLA